MYSFKFYYLEACGSLKIRQNEKLLYRIEESANTSSLNLSNIELTDDTAKAIGHALRKDVFLQDLDLSNCLLSDEGLSNILSGLEVNKFLLTLNLKGNNIRSEGTAAIGKFLRHNNHLQNLYLEWNGTGIFPEKFGYFCEGLSANTGLKSLDLRNNQLNHLCAQSLSDVIYRNSTLQHLDLRWNSIGLVGGREILKALSRNKNILKLDITGNDIPLEILKSIEFIASTNAERYLKNSEDMKKTRLFVSKFQQIEEERDKQLKVLNDELNKKEKIIESTERWNKAKINELQEALMERDQMIDELTKKSSELQKRINLMIQEKNDAVLALNEVEMKDRELKKEFQILLDKEKREKENIEKKLLEELGIIKEENFHLKHKVQEIEISKQTLEDQVVKLKSTVTKLEEISKVEEKSHEEQVTILKEKHQEKLKELHEEKKNEITMLKEEFSEIEKNLKERIVLFENRKKDLERQIIEKDDIIAENRIQAEKTLHEVKKKMKEDEDKLRKQMEERIELLESANKKQEELLKENLEAFHEIQKKSIENDLLLAEGAHHTQQLEHMLETKEAEMEAAVAKVKLEVREEIDKLCQENNTLKLKIEEMEKMHKEDINKKNEDIENAQKKIQQLKLKFKEILQSENKRIDELQTSFASLIKSMKTTDKVFDLENEINSDG